jgi:aspartate aminotransferase
MTKENLSPSMFIGVEGKDIISFGSGQPDLPPPKQVYAILPTYRAFKYGLIQGQLNLRQALANQYPNSTADSFVITNGASEALDLTLRVLARIGNKNKVLLSRPHYYSYPLIVKYSGMEPIYTELVEGRIDFDDFEKKIQECKAVIINSPSNPTGRVESIKTLKQIEKITNDLGVYVLSDEVYKDLIYVRENYLIKGPHVVTINSFSKTYALCGFRVGYLWSLDQELVNKIIEMKTHTSMNTNILGQEMAYEATKVPRSFIDKQIKIWKHRRNLIYEGLVSLGLDLWKPEGAFYVLPKVKNPKDFVWNMFKKYKVITYLGEWFGADDRVRFSYALDAEKIEEGLKRVEKYIKEN